MALSKVSFSRATSSARNALPGAKGLAIIGAISESASVSSIAKTASGPGAILGYGRSVIPLARYQPSVMSSAAKMPFRASASAIMLAIVLRKAIGSCLSASTNSTDMPCDCFAPHRRRSSSTMSLPETHGWSVPDRTTRRCLASVK